MQHNFKKKKKEAWERLDELVLSRHIFFSGENVANVDTRWQTRLREKLSPNQQFNLLNSVACFQSIKFSLHWHTNCRTDSCGLFGSAQLRNVVYYYLFIGRSLCSAWMWLWSIFDAAQHQEIPTWADVRNRLFFFHQVQIFYWVRSYKAVTRCIICEFLSLRSSFFFSSRLLVEPETPELCFTQFWCSC